MRLGWAVTISKTKGFPKKLTHTTPELLGLNNNIKTRSLRVIDFLNNDNLLPNNTTSNRIVAHVTGLSQNYFINTHAINQSFKKLFETGQVFANYIPTHYDRFKATKKGSKNFRKELSKNTKVDMKLSNWIKCLGDPTITNEEIILCNKALNWTDLGHDNLDRL